MNSTSPKPRFSEAMWFKHGEQEEAAAQAPDTEAPAHTLPVEDRYHDDGSLSTRELQRLSLRTGGTAQVPSITTAPRSMQLSDRELLAPARGAPIRLIALAVIAVLAIVVRAVL